MVLLVVAAGAFLLSTAGTHAQAASTTRPYEVTFVARECPTYQDISANLARNNIQESLQDLGPDTFYQPGQPISPSIETPHQPNCTPLVGWDFTFGSGINGTTPGTNLSRVSNPGAPMTSEASVPLLDPQGDPTGDSIAGAVTVALTPAQVSAAMTRNLWVQGGTATDPLGTGSFGDRYAFGALRCAIDNLNGDNVEWVGFPTGSTNVFCYYYAVSQTPAPGTIVIKKQQVLAADESFSTNTFQFNGSVSYNPGGNFDVPVSGPSGATGSVSFTRDSGVDWNFSELPYGGFSFTSVTCSSSSGLSTFKQGAGTPAPTLSSTVNDPVIVDLAPADVASCTYVDTRNVVDLTVLKQTTGGTGSSTFGFGMTGPSGALPDLSATVSQPDDPVVACTASSVCDTLDTGGSFPATYTVTEALPPASPSGSWAVSGFECNGNGGPTSDLTQSVTITSLSDASQACVFTDSFTPTGSLTITKTTTGGIGSTDFVVTPATPPSGESDTGQSLLDATTTQPGVPVTATLSSGPPLDPLTVAQQYSITEEGPDDTAAGTWATHSISCNGAATDPTASDTVVTLTAADPHVTCAFTNAFAATPPATTTTTTTTTSATATTTTDTGGQVAATTAALKLAPTGLDVRLLLEVGVVLVLVGLALIAVDRRRRPQRPVPVPTEDGRPS